ncbi:MAG: hypothetical protein HQM12_05835 [SAR324 cluster bacterium]|nr:hypothetical protein [SAR324 cluster bacterium]
MKAILGIVLMSMLVGCSSQYKSTPQKTRDEIEVSPYKPLTGEKADGLEALPEVPVAQMEDKKGPRLFTIAVENTDIRKVLKAFARDSQLSIVIDPDVEGNVSVDLKQVTLEEILFFMLDPIALDYSREGNVLRVFRKKFETRIFTLNHLMIKRSSKGEIAVSSIGETAGGTGTGSITSEMETDFWVDLEKQLKALVGLSTTEDAAAEGDSQQSDSQDTSSTTTAPTSSGGLGSLFSSASSAQPPVSAQTVSQGSQIMPVAGEQPKLVINKNSGLILVRASKEIINDVAKFLEVVENSVHRQVRIEAKIAEVTLDDNTQFGVNWERITPFGERQQNGVSGFTSEPPFSDSSFFSATIRGDRGRASAILRALQENQEVKILSSPSISTLNNQPAIIKIAKEQPVFSIKETPLATSGTPIIQRTAEKEHVTIGISLRVTPYISENGDIMIDIHPVITDTVGEDAVIRDPQYGTIMASAPVLSVREINTMVNARNGETILIAGLIKDRVSESENKVPILSEIPILGELFKSTKIQKEKTELVILLTPTIITGRTIHQLSEREKKYFKQKDPTLFQEL